MNVSSSIIIQKLSEDKLESVKAFLTSLKLKFEIIEEQPYDEDFVKMIQKEDEDIQKGNFTRVKKEDLGQLLGL